MNAATHQMTSARQALLEGQRAYAAQNQRFVDSKRDAEAATDRIWLSHQTFVTRLVLKIAGRRLAAFARAAICDAVMRGMIEESQGEDLSGMFARRLFPDRR